MSYRKIYSGLRTALSLVAAICLSSQLSAQQIVFYNRTVLTGQTYTQIPGGTVINTNAGLSTGMSQNADDGSRLVTLPFTFTYDNNPFTQVTFCTNGWVGMGNQTTSVTAAQGRASGNLFLATVPNNTIAAWFGDMSANFPAPAGIGSMVHGLVGTDIYALEWRNATGSGFGSTTVNLINFMIKLYGPASIAPGRIEILYGPQSGALTTGRTIGIEDANGGANRFINALNGSFTSTATAGAWPGNGSGYRFDPPPPCTGTPNAGTITAPVNVCPGSNFTMSLSGHSIGPGITYQWQSRPVAGTFTNMTGAIASAVTTTTTVPREYRCVVTCINSAQTVITPVVPIGINSFYVCYCKTGLGGDATASIDSVKIVGTPLNNGSPGTAAGSYTQYLPGANTTASLQAGGLYTLKVKYGASSIGSMWIDANQNNTFEASEWVRINTSGSEGVVVFKVPPTALPGLTGMRIRSAAAGATNGAGNACSNIASGETEDYVITITPAPVNDIKLHALLTPVNGKELCPYKPIEAKVVVYNNGSAAQTNFSVHTELSGPIIQSNNILYTNTLAPFTTDTLLITTYVLQLPGIYNVRARTSLAGDANIINDSSAINSFKLNSGANPPIVRIDSVCFGEEAMLYVLPDSNIHHWYLTSQYGTKVFTGDTMRIPNIQKDTFLYVSAEPKFSNVGSLATLSSGGNGCGGGAMFDITPNNNLRVDSFGAVFAATGTQAVSVYYRVGTFAGNETVSGAWTLLGTTNVNVSSTTAYTNFSVNAPLPLAPGNTYGIYVNYNATYTNGSNAYSNADMTIQTGTGLCNLFGGTNANRMFNGTVYYSKGPAICEGPLEPIRTFVGPAPVVNLGVDIKPCEDQDVILDAGHAGGVYMWNNMLQTQTINVKNASGTYWVEVDKYCKRSDTINVDIQPLPYTSGISFQRTGNTYKFTAGGIMHATSLLWMFGDGTTHTDISPEHTYATGGSYKVLLILFNDCGADTTALIIPLGVSSVTASDNNVLLYPNPANDRLIVELENAQSKGIEISIVNSVGTVVWKQKSDGSKKQHIDIGNLPTGNYILKLHNEEIALTKPFVIAR